MSEFEAKYKEEIYENKIDGKNKEEEKRKEQSLNEILEDIMKDGEKVFLLVKEEKHKESAQELEKILFKMKKALITPPKNYEEMKKAKENLEKIKTNFEVLKKYYELVSLIWNEANAVSSKNFKHGSIVNKMT